MVRLILSVAVGFLIMEVLALATQFALLQFFFRSAIAGIEMGQLPPAYLLANGACSLFYAVIGGCIAASIGRRYEAPTILGALMLGMGIGSLFMNRGGQPIWYAAAIPVIGALMATMAGYSWLGRQPGVPRKGD